ncbi:MAG: hypothetical protein H6658_01715 [Ardenticatenaceae bacterium]|nr:hypothetical protein [Ardenticatenaceae bacterium]
MAHKMDELDNLLSSVTDLSQKIDLLNHLAWELRERDRPYGLRLCEQAYSLARESHYRKGLADSLALVGYFNHYKANYALALPQLLEAVALFEELNYLDRLPVTLTMVGMTYLRLGNYAEALPYHRAFAQMREQKPN